MPMIPVNVYWAISLKRDCFPDPSLSLIFNDKTDPFLYQLNGSFNNLEDCKLACKGQDNYFIVEYSKLDETMTKAEFKKIVYFKMDGKEHDNAICHSRNEES